MHVARIWRRANGVPSAVMGTGIDFRIDGWLDISVDDSDILQLR